MRRRTFALGGGKKFPPLMLFRMREKRKLGLLVNFGSYPRVTIERYAL